MSELAFDYEGLFDEDYLYFQAERLEARSDSEAELLWQLLELRPGMEVLDLACGHGRIANRLAQRGCRVTGLDSSSTFLEVARRDADARAVTVDYVHGDMRNLEWFGRFDRIINWGNAFGYFDDAANRQVLAQAAAALKPDGRLAIDLINYLAVARKFEAPTVDERDGNILIDQRRLDLLTSTIVFDRTIIRDGRTRRIPYFLRMLTYTELRDWLRVSGFTKITGHSSNQDPLTVDTWRVIVIAQTGAVCEREGTGLPAG